MFKNILGLMTLITITIGLGSWSVLTGNVWAGIGCGICVLFLIVISMSWID